MAMAMSEAMVEAAIRGAVSAAIREGAEPTATAAAVARAILEAAAGVRTEPCDVDVAQKVFQGNGEKQACVNDVGKHVKTNDTCDWPIGEDFAQCSTQTVEGSGDARPSW